MEDKKIERALKLKGKRQLKRVRIKKYTSWDYLDTLYDIK